MKEAAFWPGWSVWGRWRGVARRQPGGGGAESARLHREFQRCFRGHAGESLAASSFQTGWQRGPCRARVLDNAVFMFSVVTMGKIRIDGFHGDYLKISFPEGPMLLQAQGLLSVPSGPSPRQGRRLL